MKDSLPDRANVSEVFPAGIIQAPGDGRAGGSPGERFSTFNVYMMFFCSGLASLICEVVWFRQLQFVLGSSTFAVSVVVASFFGGLGLGSFCGGRMADRWRRLLRAYAFLELSLALVSVT